MKKYLSTIILLFLTLSTLAQKVDSVKNLSEIQVTGIRINKKDPITLTKINCDSLFFLNQQKDPFTVLSQASPSIYSQSDNGMGTGYCYMRLRGLDQTRINYSLNGINLNEMEDQGIYFSNMPTFYNYISSIDAQRGVGTSKYGNTSVAGSINMETIDMSQKLFTTTTSYGNYGTLNYNILYSSGINDNGLSLQLGGGYLKDDGFKEHSGNEGGSIFYSIGYFKKNNIFKIYGFNGIAHNQLAFYGVPKDSLKVNYKLNLNLVTDRDTFRQNFICLNWINQKKQKLKFNTSLYYNNINGDYSTGGILFGVDSHQIGIMSNMVYTSPNNILNIGLNANIYERSHFGSDSSGYFTSNLYRYTNTGHKEDVISYIKYTIIINDINIFTDIQFRDVWFRANTQSYITKIYNWVFINPKIGAKILNKKNDWFISLANTKREPTRTDMVQNAVQNANVGMPANTDNIILLKNNSTNLKPENVYDIEIGNNYHYKNLFFNINVYNLIIKNEYVANGIIDPYSGFMIKQVTNSTLRTGIEGDGKYNIPSYIGKFSILWNFQYQYSRLSDSGSSTKIPFCPNLILNSGISYSNNTFIIGTLGQYVSSMIMNMKTQTVSQKSSNGYFVINGFINFKLNDKTSLSIKIDNILNSKYYIPAGIGYYSDAKYQPVPTYYVGTLSNWNISIKHSL